MEWGDRAKAAAAADERAGGGEGLGGFVKVMTDEQMEVLRKQISIYATICEQLVEMHRTLTEHQDSIAGRSAHLLTKQVLLSSLAAPCFLLACARASQQYDGVWKCKIGRLLLPWCLHCRL